jgi:large subunit ribosomal protein L7/L12
LPLVDLSAPCPHFRFKAKKFVESLPKILKENLSKEDAEKMKATFEGLGAVVKLE